MAVTRQIAAAYMAPRRTFRRQLRAGVGEDRALAYLMIACGLIFLAQWPRLSREAVLSTEVPFEALLGGALLGWIFVAPLAFYGLAALSHLVARALGGVGSWFSARLALFWTLLCVATIWLLHGLVAGLIGPGPQLGLIGLALAGAFVVLWGAALYEAERRAGVEGTPGAHR